MPVNYATSINELAQEVYQWAENKGYWEDSDDENTIPAKLALIHSEVSEAHKVHRLVYDDSPIDGVSGMTDMQEDDFTEELADIVIRILDLAGGYDLELGEAIVNKIEKNKNSDKNHYRY